MDERQRLAFLTKHYNRLKNLRLAPVYLFFIFSSWINFEQVSVREALIALALGIAWFWSLNQYYKEHYGEIEDRYDGPNKNLGARLATLPYVAISIVASYFIIVRGSHLPLDFTLWFVVAAVFAEGLSYPDSGLRRWYYVVVGIICAVALLLGFLGDVPGHHFFRVYEFTFLGVGLLALSIFDHILLVHTFRPVSSEINV